MARNANGRKSYAQRTAAIAAAALMVVLPTDQTRPNPRSQSGQRLSSIPFDTIPNAPILINPSLLGAHGEETQADYDRRNQKFANLGYGKGVFVATVVDGEIVLHDISRDGMDPQLFNWLAEIIRVNEKYILAANASGNLEGIKFSLESDINFPDELVVTEPTASYGGVNWGASIDITFSHVSRFIYFKDLSKTLRHEIGHSLIDHSLNESLNGDVEKPEGKQFADACRAVRDKALIQLEPEFAHMANLIDAGKEQFRDNPELFAALEEIAKIYRKSPIVLEDLYVNHEMSDDCEIPDFYDLLLDLTSFSIIDQSKDQDDIDFIDFLSEYSNLAMQKTTFRFLTESTYDDQSDSGHPYGGKSEFGASSMALLMDPENIAKILLKASKEDQTLTLDALSATAHLVAANYPQLASQLALCSSEIHQRIYESGMYSRGFCK